MSSLASLAVVGVGFGEAEHGMGHWL